MVLDQKEAVPKVGTARERCASESVAQYTTLNFTQSVELVKAEFLVTYCLSLISPVDEM